MATHLQDFTYELLDRHGPRTIGMILHGFTNMGYLLRGTTLDEQYEEIAKAISDDPRFVVVSDNPGRGGDWIGLKGRHEVAPGQ